MIIGVDPKHTTLSDEERNKVIVRSLIRLGLGRLDHINNWSDGLIEVIFRTSEDYIHPYIIRDGLVEVSLNPREAEDGLSYQLVTWCLALDSHLGIGSLCYEGCGCSCTISHGYTDNKPREPTRAYSAHCRGVDLSKTSLVRSNIEEY